MTGLHSSLHGKGVIRCRYEPPCPDFIDEICMAGDPTLGAVLQSLVAAECPDCVPLHQ